GRPQDGQPEEGPNRPPGKGGHGSAPFFRRPGTRRPPTLRSLTSAEAGARRVFSILPVAGPGEGVCPVSEPLLSRRPEARNATCPSLAVYVESPACLIRVQELLQLCTWIV